MAEWFRTRDWGGAAEAVAFLGSLMLLSKGYFVLGVPLFFVFIAILGRRREA